VGIVSGERNGPLDGVTVLDLTRILPGPLTGRLLAELGADVVKIEPPGGEQGYAVAFMYLEGNRSKRSQALDLTLEDGRRAFLEMASTADVVVENARAGVWDGLGIGEAQLREKNPALIYARAKGFGLDGPYARLRAFEHVLQAMTGMQRTQGGAGPPRMMTVPACDYAAPVYLAIGIVCGLLARRRGVEGHTVTSSLAAAASVYEAEHLTCIEPSRRVIDSAGPDLRGPDATRRIYRVVDGWVLVLAGTPEQQDALGRALGVGELEQSAIADALAAISRDHALAMLGAAGVPAAPSVHPQEVADDPQVVARARLIELVHPRFGRAVQVDTPLTLSRSLNRVRWAAPELGES
jgi:formyl-CoA transferase